MIRFLRNAAVACLLPAVQTATAQQRTHHVAPQNLYERVLIVAPWSGSGSKADPRRGKYAPSPAQMSPTSRSGIIGFQCIPSDDGQLALCEYVAPTRAAFSQLLSDHTSGYLLSHGA